MCWTLINVPCCYLSKCSQSHACGSCRCRDQYELFAFRLIFCGGVFSERGESATDLKDQIAHWTFYLWDSLPGTMLTILAAGSVFFPGLFLLSKQCLKSIPALRWSEGDAVIVSARWELWKNCLCFLCGLTCEHLIDADMLSGLLMLIDPILKWQQLTTKNCSISVVFIDLSLYAVFCMIKVMQVVSAAVPAVMCLHESPQALLSYHVLTRPSKSFHHIH